MVAIPLRPSRDVLAWFFSRVVREGECWRWIGSITKKGYGMAFGTSAHRATHLWFVGPIPDGFQVDHLCRHTWCVHPAHGEAVTIQENRKRADAARTHCANGLHPRIGHWSHSNGRGGRTCAECHKLRQITYLQRKAAA